MARVTPILGILALGNTRARGAIVLRCALVSIALLVAGAPVQGQNKPAKAPDSTQPSDPPKKASDQPKKTDPADKKDLTSDVGDIPFKDLNAGGDKNKRYLLIGPKPGDKAPAPGYRLILVLPGGDGSEDFRPFVQRVLKNAASDGCVIAQLVAPKWSSKEDRVVWPTSGLKDAAAKFTTEEFIDAVVKDAKSRLSIDAKRIDALGWSSGGPAIYAAAARAGSPLRGAFVAMSVFKPDQLPSLKGGADKRFYLLHSPQDVIKMRFPEDAKAKLSAAGATVKLVTYEGGHGWRGDVYKNIRDGLDWLDKKD